MKTRTFRWEKEDNVFVAETQDEQDYGVAPLCPICNQQTEWYEFTVGQDRMGNEIDAGNFICWRCQISTDLEYLD